MRSSGKLNHSVTQAAIVSPSIGKSTVEIEQLVPACGTGVLVREVRGTKPIADARRAKVMATR